jgi:hypothetical protein
VSALRCTSARRRDRGSLIAEGSSACHREHLRPALGQGCSCCCNPWPSPRLRGSKVNRIVWHRGINGGDPRTESAGRRPFMPRKAKESDLPREGAKPLAAHRRQAGKEASAGRRTREDNLGLAGFMVLFGVERTRSTIASDSCGSQCVHRNAPEGLLPGLRDYRRFVPARGQGHRQVADGSVKRLAVFRPRSPPDRSLEPTTETLRR